MQHYIEQLIEDFNHAESEPVADINFGDDYEDFIKIIHKITSDERIDAKQYIGVSYEELPPPEMLTRKQMQDLMISMLNALSANGVNIVFPGNGIPVELAYRETRKLFKEGFYAFPGWTVDFCNGNCSKCAFADYCTTNKNKNS